MDANPDLKQLQARLPYLGPHGLLMFDLPPEPGERQVELANRIGLIDKQAFRELGFGTPRWEYVIQLLVNAVSLGVARGHVEQGFTLIQQAEELLTYYRCLLPTNRKWYLVGMLAGVVIVALLASVSLALQDTLEPELSARTLVLVCVFAGLGSIASILSRLRSMVELQNEHSRLNVIISGSSRPVVAALVAIAVYLILDLGLVTIHVGTGPDARQKLFLVAAFLCGFSERFATEILGKVAARANGDKGTGDKGIL
jgi:hypothetical protein